MSILTATNITKIFPGTIALDGVSLSFASGKVNALVGKNGSGKSTLIRILNGAYIPTEGSMSLDGQVVKYKTPKEAFDQGISTVYQEMSLIPGLSVAENILIGRYEMKGPFVDWKKTYEVAGALLESMGIDLPLKELVCNLSVWQTQVVEIAKAMSTNPKVILLDEPTSALAQQETQILFKLIRELKKKDVIIIYISHRLQELWEIADTCAVLRDGKFTGQIEMEHATHKQLLSLMFGDVEVKARPADIEASDESVLRVEGLTRKPAYRDISFDLKKGEILGIAGMLGSGRTELLRAIFGADKRDSGKIFVGDLEVKHPNPRIMKSLGLAFTPEDRKNEGLVQILSINDNLNHASLPRITDAIFINRAKEKKFTDRQVRDLDIMIPGTDYPMTSLSGGNQQKVVVGKWLNNEPRIIIFDEPSRGIDVNAKQQIFQIIWDLSRRGISSIVVSSELEELLEVCHRILIMRTGQLVEQVIPEELNIEELYSRCMGGKD
ncbi:sugar ABC transporter ATP-binding protein [Treponema sp.]